MEHKKLNNVMATRKKTTKQVMRRKNSVNLQMKNYEKLKNKNECVCVCVWMLNNAVCQLGQFVWNELEE
jgi:hypothetical protein